MRGRGVATVVLLLVVGIAASWGLAQWRTARRAPALFPLPVPAEPAAIAEALAVLEAIPAYRGVLAPAAVVGGRADGDDGAEVEIDPRALARAGSVSRAFPGWEGLLPSVARGQIRPTATGVEETWRLACPDGCLLDLLDREPPRDCPSRGWGVVSPSSAARAWFALDARRLAEPTLGGAGLAPIRERLEALERLLGRPIREELAADLSGTGVMALDEARGPRGARLLIAFDLTRSDRVRDLVDGLVSLAVVAHRGAVRRHRDVTIGVVGTPERGIAIAIDGSLLLVADDAGPIVAAIERRRAGTAQTPPASFTRFRGSWRAESTSRFVENGWRGVLPVPERDAPHVEAELLREGLWWWLRGEGTGPAPTADPLVPVLRARWRGAQRSGD